MVMTMALASEYRHWAADCLQAAQLVSQHDTKSRLIEMARHWGELAERMAGSPTSRATLGKSDG